MSLDHTIVRDHVSTVWGQDVIPTLQEYIAIPNVSPAYCPSWAEDGDMERAVELFERWAVSRGIDGAAVETVRLEGRTPLLLIEIEPSGGDVDDTVLLYGHLDKQPAMSGWDPPKGPWSPVIESGRLYGRGGADDGYAMFGSLAAIEAVRRAGGLHTRLVVLIEASEESGSPDLPAYIEHLADRIGDVSLVICLDSGCADYEHLWSTTSLRGLVNGTLSVTMLEQGVHSGSASGVVASTFRIVRQLLDRIEDAATGELLLPELHVEIPAARVEQIQASAATVGASVRESFPVIDGGQFVIEDTVELVLNRTWRPTLSIVGFDGAPAPGDAGNVLRPTTRLQLSFRLPPGCDPDRAAGAIERTLTADPPYGATVTFDGIETGPGWEAPPVAPWLDSALAEAGRAAFGEPAGFVGEGGSIPFMGMLGERFPDAQFVITGVLGPGSNAHGPNEFLDIEMGQRVTIAVAHLLDAHARRPTTG